MRCPKCGQNNPGASWYCADCGLAIDDLNVADSVQLSKRAAPGMAVLAILLLTLTAGGLITSRGFDPDAGAASATVADDTSRNEPRDAGADGLARGTADARATVEAVPLRPRPAAPVATPTIAVRTRAGVPIWRAPRVASPPILDGVIDDWPGSFRAFDAVVFGAEDHWDGALDLSARAWVAWDDDALYIAARVFDNVFSQPASGRELHLGDSLEVQIDADLEGDWDSDVYSADDWQIGISPGDFDTRPPEAWIWRPANVDASPIRVASQRLHDGYTVEAAIPWTLLGIDPSTTLAIGMALNVSDNDLPLPAQHTMISTSPIRSWSDPRTFNTLILER